MANMFRDEKLNARVGRASGRTLSQVPSDAQERIKKMGPSKCPECGKSLLERSRGGKRPQRVQKPQESRLQKFKREAAEFQRRRIDRIVK